MSDILFSELLCIQCVIESTDSVYVLYNILNDVDGDPYVASVPQNFHVSFCVGVYSLVILY